MRISLGTGFLNSHWYVIEKLPDYRLREPAEESLSSNFPSVMLVYRIKARAKGKGFSSEPEYKY